MSNFALWKVLCIMTDSAFWILNSVATIVTSVVAIIVVMPRVVLLSDRRHLFDVPSGRKIHHDRVSRLGGVVFFPVMVFAVVCVLAVNMLSGSMAMCEALMALPRQSICAACAMLLLYFTGLRDDLAALSPWPKLAVQVVAGILLAQSGCRLEVGVCGAGVAADICDIVATVGFTVLVINAINFVDGIDGLASVLCSLCFAWQAAVGAAVRDYAIVIPAMAGLGVSASFIYFNMRGVNGKRIFMGDTGSLTLGFLATWLALKLGGTDTYPALRMQPSVAAVTPLAVPCLDAVRVVAVRLCRGRNPLLADTSHLHHILYRRGLSAWRITVALGALSGAVMTCNLLLAPVAGTLTVMAADLGLFLFFLAGAYRGPYSSTV